MGKSTIVLLTIFLASVPSEAQVINEIHIFIDGDAQIVLVDSLGRRCGYDPISHTDYEEIPRASYGDEGVDSEDSSVPDLYSRGLGLQKATTGTYTLKIIGTKQGTYDVTISMGRGLGNGDSFSFNDSTFRGSVALFDIFYSTDTTVQLKAIRLH